MSTYIPIGKLIAAHGLQGDLILQHSLGKRSNLTGIQALFIEEKKRTDTSVVRRKSTSPH